MDTTVITSLDYRDSIFEGLQQRSLSQLYNKMQQCVFLSYSHVTTR